MSSQAVLQPRTDQSSDAAWLRLAGRALLGSDPGVGKTLVALLAAEGRTLVCCPAMLQDVWHEEIATWSSFLETDDFTIVPYSRLAQARLTERPDGKVIRTTQRALTPELRRIRFDTVIADEAHYLKGRKSNWSAAFTALSKRTDQLHLLTGTPIPNWAYEMFMLLRYLYPGDPRFRGYWDWVHEWFKVGINRFSGQMSQIGDLWPHRTWDEFTQAHFGGDPVRYQRRLRGDVLDLPPMTEQVIECPMTPGQRRVYLDMRKALEATLPSGREIVSWSKGSQWPMLHAITTGCEVLERDLSARRRVPRDSSKLAMLMDLMAERTQSPTLLFCAWRHSTERVAAWLNRLAPTDFIHGGMAMRQRKRVIDNFRSGARPWLVGTYGTLAEGFTFTRADTVIRVERHAVPSKNEQAMFRIYRMGQTRPCLVIDLVTPASVDSRLVDQLAGKTDQQAALLTALDLLAT